LNGETGSSARKRAAQGAALFAVLESFLFDTTQRTRPARFLPPFARRLVSRLNNLSFIPTCTIGEQADADRLEQRVAEVQRGGTVTVELERPADTRAFDYLLLKIAVEDARRPPFGP